MTQHTPRTAITTTGLRKSYDDHVVLDGVDLDIPAGTVFSLLGPNGAGKTTVVKILSTLIGADGGQASVLGHDVAAEPEAVRAAIGVTGQYSAVDGLLTGRENLMLMAKLNRLGRAGAIRRTDELLERFDLVDAAGKPAATYSGGMRRRLDLAMTLVGGPRLIFLDEPTTGLDPRSRRDMWQITRDLVADGVTVFLTTQYLEEADQLADRIAVLDHGRIVAQGTAAELKRRVPGGHVRLINRNSGKAVEVQGGSTADGGSIDQYADRGGANQQWQMIKLSSGGARGCGSAPRLTSGTHTIQSGGTSRSFILRVPDNYDNHHPYRLIFAFHWRGGTAGDVASGGTSGTAWSYYGQQEQSNNTAILVAPQGLGNGWANQGGEDITFVDDMIRHIEGGLCVNPAQRFATGFSWGGGMSYALACARAGVFRAVAPIAGAQISGCSGGTQPIAYFGIHGISDSVLSIAQGRSLRDRFVSNNGCTAQNPREPAQGSRTHITTTYSGCRAGYPVQWAAFDGGHIPAPVDGSPNESGVATWTKTEIWRFFAQFQ
jgi:ABC-type multidrug transport system ATPase subunit/poly(3-hydroxybutyrate) depolymerase